jgi:phosphoglycolate phosphatase-like HAD superfamily hydrolase
VVRQRVERRHPRVDTVTAGDASSDLARVLAPTRAVLLDFDGPVCTFFADGRNAAIADTLRDRLGRHRVEPPAEVRQTWDPLAVLRFVFQLGNADLTAVIEDILVQGEVEAALLANPTPHAHDVIRACYETGRRLVVVSNNSARAIEAYLNRHHLAGDITAVVGRTHSRPDLMKPNREPVDQALRILGMRPHTCVLIGDSITDIEVAHTTGVRSIGYAKAPGRRASLLAAEPDAVTDSMADLGKALVSPHDSSEAMGPT